MSEHPKTILQQYNIDPKKSLGQNFLFDENVLARIVEAADLQPDNEVLEIGPGLGSLTEQLAKSARRVVAVELDDRLIPILADSFTAVPSIEIIHGDILEQNVSALFSRPYKVVANVPYYITGAILRHLLQAEQKPTTMVLTVQKEVADRMTAVPPNMSLLAVSVQIYGRVTNVTTLKAGAFWPRPDVDSAVVKIDLFNEAERPLPFAEEKRFFRVVKAGFSQKRKQLQNNLRQLGLDKPTVRTLLSEIDFDGRRRAETLTVQEWLSLYQHLKTSF